MTEHCPDWALDFYWNKRDIHTIIEVLAKKEHSIKVIDAQDYECLKSAMVAEWLELDQHHWEVNISENDVIKYCDDTCWCKIRFFSDGV